MKSSAEMTATVNAGAALNIQFALQLEAEWKQHLVDGYKGYMTPNVGVGAIVFNNQDELLLVYDIAQDYWIFLLFYCQLDGGELKPQTHEIREAKFFGHDELPEAMIKWGTRMDTASI